MNRLKNQDKLIKNIIDQIKEAQIKLGYVRETVRLYYPAASLEAMLEINAENPGELIQFLEKDEAFYDTKLGRLQFSLHKDRIEISVPPEGSEYVHKNVPKPAFLADIIELFGTHHCCTMEEIQKVFCKYDENYICEKMPEGADFDYVMYFSNPEIDEYYYCIKAEMGHTIYHRFTKEDYEALLE